MPRVRRKDLPPALFQHLLDRVQQRQIDARQLERLARWLDGEPEVPDGPWYKRISGMAVGGEGDLVKTFLARLLRVLPSRAPDVHEGLIEGQAYRIVPPGTRAFRSSVQFWTRWMCVTGGAGVWGARRVT